MRGSEVRSGSLFSYVDLETRVPRGHPLRVIRRIVDAALAQLDADFAAIYAPIGRPSIPPEQLLRALLLQAFYTVRSERQRCAPRLHNRACSTRARWCSKSALHRAPAPAPGH